MGEYTYSITKNTTPRPEAINETTGFAEWYDNADKETYLTEAVNLGFIDFQDGDDCYFLETVLDEARRLNHGPTWIKEIMDRERELDNPHISIAEEAEENGYDVETVIQAYKDLIGIRDWAIGDNKRV